MFNEAAKLEHPESIYKLGLMYFDGLGVEQDYIMAFQKIELASQAGVLDAKTKLGSMYIEGKGVSQDANKGGDIVLEALNENSPLALYTSGDYLAELGDIKGAIKLFNQAIINGSHEANAEMGRRYLYGIDVQKDPEEAMFLLEVAATSGDPTAEYILALQYMEGDHVKKDDSKSFAYFKRSASHGSVEGQFFTGYLLEHGVGTEQNTEEAVYWLKLAADKEHRKAKVLLESIIPPPAEEMWEDAVKTRTIMAYRKLIEKHPKSRWTKAAKDSISFLEITVVEIPFGFELTGFHYNMTDVNFTYAEDGGLVGRGDIIFQEPVYPDGSIQGMQAFDKTINLKTTTLKKGIIQTRDFGDITLMLRGSNDASFYATGKQIDDMINYITE